MLASAAMPAGGQRATWLALAAAGLLAGCGGDAARPKPAPTPTPAAAPPKPRAAQLVYVWRNFEFTGIPDELTIYVNGDVRYRNLLHTQQSIKILTARLRASELARLRRLLAAVDLRRADASGVKPRRSGFRYIIHSGGRVGTAADGHLHGAVRRLVRHLGAEMDRMQTNSL